MKTKLISRNIILLIGWLLLRAGSASGQVSMAEKTIVRYYKAVPGMQIIIDNDYGKIRVHTIQSPHIIIIATTKLYKPAEKDLDRLFKKNGPVFEKDGPRMLFIHPAREAEQTVFGRDASRKFQIDYIIHMPDNISLKVRADYGKVEVEKMTAPLECIMDYGTVKAGHLENAHNLITGDYLDSLDIDFMRGGNIVSDYGNIRIRFAFDLQITGDYNQLQFHHLKNLRLNGSHNKALIHRVKNIHYAGDYTDLHIDRLYGGNFTGDLNTIRIDQIMDGPYQLNFTGDLDKISLRNALDIPFVLELKGDFILQSALPLSIVTDQTNDDFRIYRAYYKQPDARYRITGQVEKAHITIEK